MNKEAIRELYEDCLNERQWAMLDRFIADDFTGIRGEKGAAGFAAAIKPLWQAFPDIRYALEDIVADGDRVAVSWKWTGTHEGVFNGYSPTGKTVTNEGMAVFQFRDGKIVHGRILTDRLGFLQQIGVVAPDLGAALPLAGKK